MNVLTGQLRDDPYIYSLSEQIDKQSQLAVASGALLRCRCKRKDSETDITDK